MPRQSAASAGFSTSPPVARLRPPADLGDGPERNLFIEIVMACAPGHFQSSDATLLAVFCRAAVLEKIAASELAAAHYIDAEGRPSGWLNILTQSQRVISTYSRLLKLNPIARAPAPLVAKPQAANYYSKLALESRDESHDAN